MSKQATAKHTQLLARALELSKEIESRLASASARKCPDWGHIGDLSAIIEGLEDALGIERSSDSERTSSAHTCAVEGCKGGVIPPWKVCATCRRSSSTSKKSELSFNAQFMKGVRRWVGGWHHMDLSSDAQRKGFEAAVELDELGTGRAEIIGALETRIGA